jgi:oligoribonuclease NrnB/cAMP/cGMP phosphodiesterase (DHH superfamily)
MDKKNKYLIIYHREDNDGLFSAAIFYDYIVRVLKKDLTDLCFIGADYNDLAKFEKENPVDQLHENFKHIIMTDISFNNVNYMKSLWKEFGNDFTWCDHHAPIIKASFENHFDDVPGIRDTGRSAILCAYKYLYDQFDEEYNAKKVPELLRILSAWDSWSYEREGYNFEYVRRINKAVTYKYNLELGKIKTLVSDLVQVYQNNEPSGIFSAIFKDKNLIDNLLDTGNIICDVEDQNMENIVKNDGDKTWEVSVYDEDRGRPLFIKACAIFHQGATNSTMFKSLKKTNPDIEIGLVFKHAANGNWVLSMYNVNDDYWFHCGEFLKKKYNGGGHKGAAGCTLSEEQFINILKSKKI